MGYWYVSSKCQSVWSYKYNMKPITPGESYMFCRVCNLAGRYEVFFFGDLVNLCKQFLVSLHNDSMHDVIENLADVFLIFFVVSSFVVFL